MTTRYSALSLLREGLSGHQGWKPAWRNGEPKKAYDAIIIGGGGHGLATAYYLAKLHGMRNIALLERAWIGGGNTGRNTTVIRSNYFFPESTQFYDFALSLYEGLSRELNYNIMFSRRGMWSLAQDRHGLEMLRRSAAIVGAGTTMVALLALSDSGRPSYDADHAAALAALGIPAFACTPDQFPGLMATAIERRDIAGWAAANDIVTSHGDED